MRVWFICTDSTGLAVVSNTATEDVVASYGDFDEAMEACAEINAVRLLHLEPTYA